MKTKILFAVLTVLSYCTLSAQAVPKLTGPLAIYHIAPGYSSTDTSGMDSTVMEYEFRFGELAIPDQAFDSADTTFTFRRQLDSCESWHANRVFAIIQPPTEHGVYDQPSDTVLYHPIPQNDGPGMIQGGQRFSRLSQRSGRICGVILDDWNGDTAITHQVHDAVLGKDVDVYGNVCGDCEATTPDNRLYCVIYNTDAQPAVMPYMDGVYFSYYQGQNCCYTNLDGDITTLRSHFPRKEIFIAIFLKNSFLGWTDPVSVQYMLAHALDRYDDGDINEVSLFAGSFLVKDYIPLSNWKALALPHWLDSLYYPYLGQGQGKIYDCHTGHVLTDASVRVLTKGRISGDTLPRSYQRSDADGQYQFGLWAGNRSTDSTYYWLIASKDGYKSDTIGFWIKRADTTTIPDISLCLAPDPIAKGNMLIYPNPTSGRFTMQINAGQSPDAAIEIYDMLGEKIYVGAMTGVAAYINISDRAEGMYIVSVRKGIQEISRKRVVLLR